VIITSLLFGLYLWLLDLGIGRLVRAIFEWFGAA
jgi:preprotein translocase subunit SecE